MTHSTGIRLCNEAKANIQGLGSPISSWGGVIAVLQAVSVQTVQPAVTYELSLCNRIPHAGLLKPLFTCNRYRRCSTVGQYEAPAQVSPRPVQRRTSGTDEYSRTWM